MNRISAPAGLPHSCADMVRPSGVFTVIGLYFRSCPKPGCAIVTTKAAIPSGCRHRSLPLFFVIGQASTRADGVKVGEQRGRVGWRVPEAVLARDEYAHHLTGEG